MSGEITFREAVQGLMAGDFSRLEPLFQNAPAGSPGLILKWFHERLFREEPEALSEAFTCACFNGCGSVVDCFLASGVDPNGGMATGMNAFHWAANRGQLAIVEILIQHKADLETLNRYGGTVLGCAVWSAIHETKPEHGRILEALLKAGAKFAAAGYPTGNQTVDEILKRYEA